MYKKAVEYLPHRPPMVFLDDVLEITDSSCICSVETKKGGLLSTFLNEDGSLDAIMGLEMMAQCTGVWSGYHILMRHEEVSMGMLVGISNVVFKKQKICKDAKLIISINTLIEDGTFGSFECNVKHQDDLIVSGIINTYNVDS